MTRIFLILLCLPFRSPAQSTSYLGRFEGSEINNEVQLDWQMLAGSVCQGIDVYRSSDSLNFELVGHISGDCGNISIPVDFEFRDTNPLPNKKNYYQLELGLLGTSHIISVVVTDPGEKGILISPNPAIGNVEIVFNNEQNLYTELEIYNAGGKLVETATTQGDRFFLNTRIFPAGEYLVVLNIEKRMRLTEKLLIVAR